ncbi:MAG: hypothetical protein WBW06_16510, partial [Xanthobacteraceae bacterium]
MTAAAARRWWAAHRQRSPAPTRGSAVSATTTTARIAFLLPLFVAGAMMLCAATGFTVSRITESRIEGQQRAALQRALDEFHAQFGDFDAPDDVQLRTIARQSGLGDLRFDANPTGDGGRALQSLHDTRGRIVGWFSWAPDRALIHAMNWLWSVVGLCGLALAFA